MKKILLPLFALGAAVSAFAGESPLIYPTAEVLAYAKTLEPRLTEIRRDLHRHPELGFEEVRTTAKIKEVLAALPGVEILPLKMATGVMAELKAGSITLNGTTVQLTTRGTPCGVPIFIFCHNDGGGWSRRFQAMKLYSFRIFEGEELKRHFVPCVETATGEAGLYETVEGRFYGNAGGDAFGFGVEAQYYDPIGDETRTADAIEVTESTSTFEDGRGYVVRRDVTLGTIAVNGMMKLLL